MKPLQMLFLLTFIYGIMILGTIAVSGEILFYMSELAGKEYIPLVPEIIENIVYLVTMFAAVGAIFSPFFLEDK